VTTSAFFSRCYDRDHAPRDMLL